MPTTEHQLGPNPAMVIITRFSHTKERTEIHPGPCGTLYPDITREQAILRPC